ncbi:hypothetical protein BD626DRAFT_85845 [Schizophyllum amplum]|uniref:Uncharacterized protein n=1 Tax=Schizophyllum amplum TaxID=97359 RepID=A0A550C9B2_9AGAR|nr:hypothetical protein BD626DRAFT_85845 [Auriculariopsis ampla]
MIVPIAARGANRCSQSPPSSASKRLAAFIVRPRSDLFRLRPALKTLSPPSGLEAARLRPTSKEGDSLALRRPRDSPPSSSSNGGDISAFALEEAAHRLLPTSKRATSPPSSGLEWSDYPPSPLSKTLSPPSGLEQATISLRRPRSGSPSSGLERATISLCPRDSPPSSSRTGDSLAFVRPPSRRLARLRRPRRGRLPPPSSASERLQPSSDLERATLAFVPSKQATRCLHLTSERLAFVRLGAVRLRPQRGRLSAFEPLTAFIPSASRLSAFVRPQRGRISAFVPSKQATIRLHPTSRRGRLSAVLVCGATRLRLRPASKQATIRLRPTSKQATIRLCPSRRGRLSAFIRSRRRCLRLRPTRTSDARLRPTSKTLSPSSDLDRGRHPLQRPTDHRLRPTSRLTAFVRPRSDSPSSSRDSPPSSSKRLAFVRPRSGSSLHPTSRGSSLRPRPLERAFVLLEAGDSLASVRPRSGSSLHPTSKEATRLRPSASERLAFVRLEATRLRPTSKRLAFAVLEDAVSSVRPPSGRLAAFIVPSKKATISLRPSRTAFVPSNRLHTLEAAPAFVQPRKRASSNGPSSDLGEGDFAAFVLERAFVLEGAARLRPRRGRHPRLRPRDSPPAVLQWRPEAGATIRLRPSRTGATRRVHRPLQAGDYQPSSPRSGSSLHPASRTGEYQPSSPRSRRLLISLRPPRSGSSLRRPRTTLLLRPTSKEGDSLPLSASKQATRSPSPLSKTLSPPSLSSKQATIRLRPPRKRVTRCLHPTSKRLQPSTVLEGRLLISLRPLEPPSSDLGEGDFPPSSFLNGRLSAFVLVRPRSASSLRPPRSGSPSSPPSSLRRRLSAFVLEGQHSEPSSSRNFETDEGGGDDE